MADHYVGATAETVDLHGRPFSVRVHWGQVDGKVVPVGLDLRSFTSKAEQRLNLAEDARPVVGGWQAITSPVVRALRVADQVEQSRRDLLALRDVVARIAPPQLPAFDEVATALQESASPPKQRRGPKPLLSDEQLRDVVAVAYNHGGANCRQAVREALSALPVYKGDAPTGAAVAAIRRARALGLIGKAPRPDKPTEPLPDVSEHYRELRRRLKPYKQSVMQEPTSGEQS